MIDEQAKQQQQRIMTQLWIIIYDYLLNWVILFGEKSLEQIAINNRNKKSN